MGTCTANPQQYMEVRCNKNKEDCNICCLFHSCAHNWERKDIWKECNYFSSGSCSFGK